MSARRWRRAMTSGSGAAQVVAHPTRLRLVESATVDHRAASTTTTHARSWLNAHQLVRIAVLAGLVVFPLVATPFITFQIGAQALALGLIALSLTFLGGYGGMISLAQMTVAGIAGYALGILGASSMPEISLSWPWWLAAPLAIALGTICAAGIGPTTLWTTYSPMRTC